MDIGFLIELSQAKTTQMFLFLYRKTATLEEPYEKSAEEHKYIANWHKILAAPTTDVQLQVGRSKHCYFNSHFS